MTSEGVATACAVAAAVGLKAESRGEFFWLRSSLEAPGAPVPAHGVLAESAPYGTFPFCVPAKATPSFQGPLKILYHAPFIHLQLLTLALLAALGWLPGYFCDLS